MVANRTQEEWKQLAADYEASGLKQEAWCIGKGINLSTFRDRLSRIRKVENENTNLCQKNMTSGSKFLSRTEQIENKQKQTVQWLQMPSSSQISHLQNTEISINESVEEAHLRVKIGEFEIIVPVDFNESCFSNVCSALKSLC